MTCLILTVAMGVCILAILVLSWHHYEKHEELDSCDRCFQIEDVCVCCMMDRPISKRCSHEMWVCVFGVVFVACWLQWLDGC